MLKPEVVSLVKELLAGGKYSQRQIALRTGISRASIGNIASGKRHIAPPDEPADGPGVTARCPQCGGKVVMPCRICRVRKYQEQKLAARRFLARHGGKANPPGRRPAA